MKINLLFYFLSICQSIELHKYLIDATQLQQELDSQKPIFVAFYEEVDLTPKEIKFLKNVLKVVDTHNTQFYWFKERIPQSIEKQYYLHYYTLPKLKFFKDSQHETYLGGKSQIMIEKWLNKKIAKKQGIVREIKDQDDFMQKLKDFKTIMVYVGNEDKNFLNFLSLISKYENEIFYHMSKTLARQINNQIEIGFSKFKHFVANYFTFKQINSLDQLENFIKQDLKNEVIQLNDEIFKDLLSNPRLTMMNYGVDQLQKNFKKFCRRQSQMLCLEVIQDFKNISEDLVNYFPLEQSIIIFENRNIYGRFDIYQDKNASTFKDIENFYKKFQQKQIKKYIFTEPEKSKIVSPYFFHLIQKDFETLLKNFKGEILVQFHGQTCSQCELFKSKAEEIGNNLAKLGIKFYFGEYNTFLNDPPIKVMKNPEYYLFTKDIKNPLKLYLPKDIEKLEKFILKTSSQILNKQFIKMYLQITEMVISHFPS